jgi:chromosome segregation ATPase
VESLSYSSSLSTRDLVFLAADSIARQSIKPTVQEVMKKIGRGSKSTVVDALGDWWLQALPKAVDAAKPDDVPAEAFDLVKRLHGILSEAAMAIATARAESAFVADRRQFDEQLQVARAAADAAERERDIAADRAEREVQLRNAVEERLARAQADAEGLRERLTYVNAKYDASLAALAGKGEMVIALQGAKQELEARLAKLEQQTAHREQALKTQMEKLQAEREDQDRRHDTERREQAQILSDLRSMSADLRADLESERLSHKQTAELLASARDELDARATALDDASKEIAKLQEGLHHLRQEACTASEREEGLKSHITELEKRLVLADERENGTL